MTEKRTRVVQPRVIASSRSRHAGRPAERRDILRIGELRVPHRTVLLLILLIAAALRFAGIGWGDNHYLHPDERFMTMVAIGIDWPGSVSEYFDSETSPLNPYNNTFGSYVYGTLPLFLAKLIGTITNDVVYGDAHLPGRWLSAIADIGVVALTFWIARRLFSSTAGLIAAALLAFTPLHIQTAHYFTTDSVATFFAVAAFAAVLQAWFRRSWGWFVIAGACVGFATASKPNLLITTGFLVLPALESIRLHGWRSLLPPWSLTASTRREAVRFPVLIAVVLAGFAAFIAFRVSQPYAFLGPAPWSVRLDPRWTATLDYWREVQAGVIDLPPGIQWADRTPFVFILDNLVRWGMGPALGLTALLSVLVFGLRMGTARKWPSWWLLAVLGWVVFHIAFYGTGLAKAQRYLLPAYPFLIVLAAGLLDAIPARISLSRWRGRSPKAFSRVLAWSSPARMRIGTLLTVLVIGGTMFSGLALTNVFLKPHSRVVASEWIYENIPAGSAISSEYWDDGLPIPLPDYPTGEYAHVQFSPYDADTDAKLSEFIGQLHRVDYIILSSDRLIGSIPRMPDRYPMATAYYEALVSGELGFDLLASFESPPELLGIELDDRGAEESLTVYDHPYVRIFEKTDRYSTQDAWYLLNDALGDGAVNRRVIDLPQSTLMLSEQERVAFAESGTWSDIFDPDSVLNALPAVWWYLVLQLFSIPAVSIAWRLFSSLPDRGYALSKTIGIFGVAWIAWLLASLHIVEFGRLGIGVALAIAAAIGGVAAARSIRPMLADLRWRWRWVVATEVLFLVSFAAISWLRALNPDLWQPGRGGEKPMELAIFNAILRSPWFPPYDPWFAGGTLHYYYFGYVPWATISRLTGIVPEVAFNLAFPSLYALLLLNVWIAAAALISRMQRTAREGDAPDRAGTRWRLIVLALGAPVFVGVLGNLDFVRRLGRGEWGYPPAPSWMEPFGDAGHIVWGIWNALTGGGDLTNTAFWDPTRVIPNTINEFPYFSLLFGDLHAHVLAMPVIAAVIVVAICIALSSVAPGAQAGNALLGTIGGWRRMAPVALAGGFFSGSLIATNTWEYPPAVAPIIAAAAISAFKDFEMSAAWRRVRDVVIFAAIVVISGRVLFQPYISNYGSIPFQPQPGTETTRLSDYLTIHGVMMIVIAGYLVIELGRMIQALWRTSRQGRITGVMLIVALASAYATAFLIGNTALFLVAGLLTLVLCACGRRSDASHLMLLAMIGLAFVLALAPERYRLENDVGRMNVVFKFYLHAWQLLGIASAVALVQVISTLVRAEAPIATGGSRAASVDEPDRAHRPQPQWGSVAFVEQMATPRGSRTSSSRAVAAGAAAGRVWLVIVCVAILGAVSYPLLVTGPRLADRFNSLSPTLDGLAYMEGAVWGEGPDGGQLTTFPLADDREAITWLRQNIEGSPVILEAQLPAYRWGGRISSITGLPTILGWTWHQIQQRPGYGEAVQERVDDIATVYGGYGSFESIQPTLEQYHVELIYVGDLERALYDEIALSKFSEAAERGELDVVYEENGVTIYAIPGSDVLLTPDEADG